MVSLFIKLWAAKEEKYDFGGLVITGWQEKGLCEDGFEMGSFGFEMASKWVGSP